MIQQEKSSNLKQSDFRWGHSPLKTALKQKFNRHKNTLEILEHKQALEVIIQTKTTVRHSDRREPRIVRW